MFEWILIIVALVGSAIAGFVDLKTTEIPDEIPYIMMGVGIIAHIIESIVLSSYNPILYSAIAGFGFLLFGFFMYYTGQWGGGDAKLLSALGFLLPTLSSKFSAKLFFPFSLSLFFNVFFIGAIYMIVYAIVLAFIEKKIWYTFVHELRANSKILVILNVAVFILLIGFGVLAIKHFFTISFLDLLKIEIKIILLSIGLFLVWRFSKTVEEVGFKKKIPVSHLKVGDVLLDSKLWEGLTKEQIKEIKKSGKKYVWIKEGVRFGLAFPLALIFTLLIGDGIILLINLI